MRTALSVRSILTQIVIAATVGLALLALRHRPSGMPWFLPATQGLPTLVMLVFAAMRPADVSRRYRWAIVAALGLSLVGGYFLSLSDHFVAGVFGFLAANVAYLTAFTTDVRFAKRMVPFAILGLGGATVLALVWPQIPRDYVVPVCLYAAAIVSVPAQAIGRYLVARQSGTVLAAIGATSLLVSDSAIAIERFYAPFQGAGLFIMATYFGGQWLIATSVSRARM